MNKHILFFILCLFLNFFPSFVIHAEEFTCETNSLDIMFVMDYSGSMKANDPEDIARGMVKAFIDTVHSTDIRVGFVAYNDRILSSTSPQTIRTSEERLNLKNLIDEEVYYGNTDIGLGLSYARELIETKTKRKQVIVLISDGESDLRGSHTGRDLAVSQAELRETTQKCAKEDIPIYTIAFGTYDGNKEVLVQISEKTSAQMYTVETPERLMEILYGIFNTNMDYRIQKITDSAYASGMQSIRIGLEEKYLDELDVLLISPQSIGDTHIFYGNEEIETINLKNYVVGKITEVNDEINELTVQVETKNYQNLQLYMVSYRALLPILNINTFLYKNEELDFAFYFKDKTGNIVKDNVFYQDFTNEIFLTKAEEDLLNSDKLHVLKTEIIDGYIQGKEILKQSGTFFVHTYLEDSMGKVVFPTIEIQVQNRCPEGGLPVNERYTVLMKEQMFSLDEYFSDPDGDNLTYALKESLGSTEKKPLQTELNDGILRIKPVKSGKGMVQLEVTDGEAVFTYTYEAEVIPLWKVYWWIIVLLVVLCAVLFWKLKHKAKPELKQLVADTRKNQFCGRLDAYFTVQPETEEEILPLSFSMHQFTENKLSLDALFKAYPEAIEALELDAIYLVADEDRRMVLYHRSKGSVMIGNSIACKEIQYSVSFGNVIYITSPDKRYDLELHYIAVIQ